MDDVVHAKVRNEKVEEVVYAIWEIDSGCIF